MRDRAAHVFGRDVRNLPYAEFTLCGLVIGSACLILFLTRNLTFYQDTWEYLLRRQHLTLDTLLAPHNEHIVAIPVALEHLLVVLFGMRSALPETLLLIALLSAAAGLIFIYVSRRIGPWPGVFAAALLLFLGAAWEELLWGFQVCFVGSIVFGVLMLLVLERLDKKGDIAACLALTISIGFSSLGVAFILGAAISVWQEREVRGMRRIVLVLIPAAMFLAWYIGWGHTAEHHVTVSNLLASPRYVAEGLASSIDSALGLSTIPVGGSGTSQWGIPLLVALSLGLGYRFWRGWSPPATFWTSSAVLLAYWLLAAANTMAGREASSVRYTYAGVAIFLLVAANSLSGIRFPRKVGVLAAIGVCLAIGPNLVLLHQGSEFLSHEATITKADIGAIDVARRTIAPSFTLTPEIAGTPSLIDVNAAEYLSAAEHYGSPGFSVSEIRAAPPFAQAQADIALASALPITRSSPRVGDGAGRCQTLKLSKQADQAEVPLRFGFTQIEPSFAAGAHLYLRRFQETEFPVDFGAAPPGEIVQVGIPRDYAPAAPWHLLLEGSAPVSICRADRRGPRSG